MLLDLSRIRTPHERYDKTFEAAALAADRDDFRVASPVSLAFDVFKDNATFRLVGTVRAVLELPCSRCLEPFAVPVDAGFDLRYQPHTQNTGEGEREVEEDDLTTAFYDRDQIDLGQLMCEQFYLALPMKPLCDAACRGLCPVCGLNLNKATCTCRHAWEDPRLAVLKALQKDS